ncbi:MAG: hypothetical protein WC955_02250 [Elusimicrobiota bacterium]
MNAYLKKHETHIRTLIENYDPAYDWEELYRFHNQQIKYLQHERLIHLLVTLAFAIMSLLTVFFTLYSKNTGFIIVDALFFILLIPYIIHYFKLENSVQGWYRLANQIYVFKTKKIKEGACQDEKNRV